MTTYFISDIHLNATTAVQSKMLLQFLQQHGAAADAIYILGDFFAIWLGDDFLSEPYSKEIAAALKKLSQQNVPLYFMRGNRDFLVGRRFCKATGCKMLADPCIINLYDEKILLTHGDLLCTADRKYQKFRKVVQNPLLRNIFLLLPKSIRKNLGSYVKQKAMAPVGNPAAYDVELTTVKAWFKKFKASIMIHGHTHKPAIHDNDNTRRIVLGEWLPETAKILVVEQGQYELRDLCRA